MESSTDQAGYSAGCSRCLGGMRAVLHLLAVSVCAAALLLGAWGCSLTERVTTTTAVPTTATTAAVTSATVPGSTGTTAAGRPITGGSVTALALAVMEGGGLPPSGGANEFTVTVTPSQTGKVAVGVLEGEVFGTGPQWRAAAWSAPLAAVSILNLDLADFKIMYEVEGAVDGPSAGALMTAATLAAFLGDQLKADVTMTGAINPDYTIGPVGGISQKLEGAAAAGRTVVLIPSGQRMQEDLVTGEYVDVVEKGKGLGITVHEVVDIYEAYKYLTGLSLPTPRVSEREPALSEQARQAVLGLTEGWVKFCEDELATYESLPAEAKSSYEDDLIAEVGLFLDDAAKYQVQGLAGPAYAAAVAAGQSAALAVNYTAVENGVQATGVLAEAQAQLDRSLTPAVDEVMQDLVATTPRNVGEAAALLEAWGNWTVASGLAYEADSILTAAPTDPSQEEELLTALYEAVYDYTLAGSALDLAKDSQALGAALEGPAPQDEERLTELAEAYRRAAEANLDTFEVLVLPGLAEGWNMTESEALDQVAFEDANFAEAQAATSHFDYLKNTIPAGKPRAYAVLGAALTAYADSSVSLARYYSYGAQTDEEGYVTGYTFDKALAQALDLARSRARSMISLAGVDRADAATPTLYYESGGVNREGYPGQKLDALYDYWTATLLGRVMAVVGGGLTPLAPR